MASYDSPSMGFESEDAPMAEKPLGADLHETLNSVTDIDNEIMRLKKKRAQFIERFERSMNEVQRHYSDTVNGPTEAPGF